MEGFSPFTLLDLSEDEVALLNNEENLITSVSLVRVYDLRQQQKQQKFCIPADADEFMIILKCYTNLVYMIFWRPAHFSKCLER